MYRTVASVPARPDNSTTGECIGKSVSYSPCLRTALERAHQLGLFTPQEVLQYFEDYMQQTRFPPLEVEYNPTVFSVIALLIGELDEVLAPLLSRLSAAVSEEAKPAEQAA
jgi:hypothetical protein